MYSVYSTILRTGGENTRGGTTVAATRPSAAMPRAAPAAISVAERVVRRGLQPVLGGGSDQRGDRDGDQDDRVPPVAKCPGAQEENGGNRSEHHQLRPFPLAVGRYRDP